MPSVPDRLPDGVPRRMAGSRETAVSLQALRKHPRRLLYAAGSALTLLLLAALVWLVLLQARAFTGAQLQEFERGRAALQAHMARQSAGQARLSSMARFAWEQRLGLDPRRLMEEQSRFFEEEQRLPVRFDEQSAPLTVVGHGTEGWPPALLRRYLALARQMSLNRRLAFTGESGDTAPDAFFLAPNGQLAVLDAALDERALMQGLSVVDREGLLANLRAYTRLLPPVAPGRRVAVLRSRVGADTPGLGVAAHPVTGEPAIVRRSAVRAGTTLVGILVSFEPTRNAADVLRDTVQGNLLVVAPSGRRVLDARGSGDAELVLSLQEAGVWANAQGEVTRYQHGVRTFIAARVPETDWTLVTSYDWRDLLVCHSRPLGLAVSGWAVLVTLLWLLLVWIDQRIFAPTVASAAKVYASERISRSMIEMAPIGLCLVEQDTATLVLQNELAQCQAQRAAAAGVDLVAELTAGYRACQGGGGHTHARTFAISHPLEAGQGLCHLGVSALLAEQEGRSVLLCALHDCTAEVEQTARQQRLRLQAEAASEAKSRFLATMSHEIRTPLHGILGHLELLERAPMAPEQRVRVRRITQSADSLLLIVNDVLDVSRIESGQLDLETVAFEPVALLERVALLYAPLAQAKGVDLDFTVDPALAVQYRGAVNRMEQVLRNLVSNAVKFTASGRIELRVAPGAHAGQLRFEVADSGMGLSLMQQKRLFQPFAQADGTIGTRFGGTGLGLSLCRQLCQVMGGDIEVRSTPGVGSVFAFTVRVEAGNGVPGELPLRGQPILLVSAVITWREELARRLRSWGAEVVVSDAMTAVAAHPALPIVLFERNLPIADRPGHVPSQPLIRVRADGPLRALQRDGQWWVSCYAGQGLLDAVQAVSAHSEAGGAGAVPVRPAAGGMAATANIR